MRALGRTTIVVHRKVGDWTSSVAEKVAWLSAHAKQFKTEQEIVSAMKKAGLIAKSTYWRDVRLSRYFELVNGRNETTRHFRPD